MQDMMQRGIPAARADDTSLISRRRRKAPARDTMRMNPQVNNPGIGPFNISAVEDKAAEFSHDRIIPGRYHMRMRTYALKKTRDKRHNGMAKFRLFTCGVTAASIDQKTL
jgi:hypothetical protein